MIVCPSCRHANDEERQLCERCGASLEPGPMALAPRRSGTDRPPIEIRKPASPSKWRPIVIVGILVFGVAAFGVFQLVKPNPCEGTNFRSETFGYCLTVPEGWTAEPALFGAEAQLDQFAPPEAATTVVVDAADLEEGVTLDRWAEFVRNKDAEAGLTPGPASETVVDGVTAQQWDVSVTSDTGTDYRMREVVVVRDEIGWRIALNDTEDTFAVSAATFEQMVESWRFR